MSFFAELKRRNVFRMGALYLVAGWVLLQVADVLAGVLGLPDWTMRLVAFLLLLGFPLALIFSWVYELTPEGLKRDVDVDRSHSIATQTGRKLNVVIVGLLAAAVTLLALDKLVKPDNAVVVAPGSPASMPAAEPAATGASPGAPVAKSIAVLPFVNMSADQNNAYFSDGLSEELLNFLAKVDGLKVAARTSSFKFRNSESDIAEIGEALKVSTVLEGSVRKAGNDVRITAQLIEVDSGYHLWSQTYDRSLDNIFAVQEEIARAIVDALKLPLLGKDAAPLKVASTSNVEAYDLYLLGRHHARETTDESLQKAIDYFQQAIAADPAFALAYSGLADAYMLLSDYGGISIDEADRLAEPAAHRAMELDPGAAEPYASMGLILDYRFRAEESIAYFDKALAINPNYVNALLWKSSVLEDAGRYHEAAALTEQAYELDPLSNFAKSRVVNSAASTGDYARAEKLIREMIAADPDDPFPYEEYGNLYYNRGELSLAVPHYIHAHRLRPGDTFMAWQLVDSFIGMDDEEAARAWYEEARRRGPETIYTGRARMALLRFFGEPSQHLAFALQRAEKQPENAALRTHVGRAHLVAGDLARAEADLRLALDLAGYRPAGGGLIANQFFAAALLAATLVRQGKTEESEILLGELDALREHLSSDVPGISSAAVNQAWVAAIRGEREIMLDGLERAFEGGMRGHVRLLRNPILTPYLDDPRFQALIERMRASEAAMRQRLIDSGQPRLPGDASNLW